MDKFWLVCAALAAAEGSLLPFVNNHLNATIGGYVVFNCHLDFPFGIEIPYQLEWSKDGDHIFSWHSEDGVPPHYADSYGGRITHLRSGQYGLGRGSINLTSIRETDNGNYHCLIVFPNRTPNTRNNGTFYFLEVDGGNLIVTPPINVTCMEGDRAEFECLPKSPESIIKWYKDGDPLSDLMDLSYRSILASNGSLIIEQTVMTDLGEYECRVVNTAGEVQTAAASLNVQYKAKVVYAPKERFLPYGKSASLDCFYRANPPLTNLRWEKDGFMFDPYNVPGVFYSRNGSLLFNRIDESHEGHYSCTPYNSLGSKGPSPMINVVVQRPPEFAYRPQPVYLSQLGGRVTMGCGATDSNTGTPPIVSWSRKDGLVLPEGRTSLNGGNMTLDDITEEDRGVYVCSATNDADSVTVETELMIENVAPRAPYNVTANATKNSIHVKWIVGHTSQRVDYNVWYRPSDVSEWRTMKILSRGTSEATINNLKPGIEYEIRVLSQDYMGDGLFSKSIFVRTVDHSGIESGALPSYLGTGPPTNVTAHLIDEGVLLTWNPPQYGSDHLRRYIVRWYRGRDDVLQGSQHTTNTYLLVSDISDDEQYSFVVFALATNEAQVASVRAVLDVPAQGRLRAVATATGCAALLLAAVAATVYFARDHICGLRERLADSKCNSRG